MSRGSHRNPWKALKERGDLQERHVQMAIDLAVRVTSPTGRYHGMACHFNQCPKHKRECQAPGCGAAPFVRILPRFQLKSHRLNESNSQVLFQRKEG